jgi:hypothetical protein
MRALPWRPTRLVVIIPLVLSLLACGLAGGSSVVGGTTPAPGSGDAATPTTNPFALDSVTVTSDPGNFSSGTCTSTVTFHFTATLTAPADNPGGTVTYQWVTSGGSYSAQTMSFAPGDTSHTLKLARDLSAGLGNGNTYWVELRTTAPNALTSSHANYTFQCQFAALSASVAVNPTSATCTLGVCTHDTFAFTGTVNVAPSPGGTITYHWVRSDGATGPVQTLTVPAGASSVPVNDGESWTTTKCNSQWEQMIITAPNSVLSNQATFTLTCS